MLHVYFADLTGLEVAYDEKLNMLHQSRVDKLASYKMSADKVRGLGAGLLLERGLEDYLQSQNADKCGTVARGRMFSTNESKMPRDEKGRYIIHYGYGPQGKPYLKDYPDICFNLSHSGSLAVLAVSDKEVGIDVQEFRGLNEKISKRFYHTEEIKCMEDVSDITKREMLFYKIWSSKEAYIKYTGKGMRQELRDFYCDFSSGHVIENGKVVATCMEAVLDCSNYCCIVVSDSNSIKIDKIMKIIL